MRAMPENESDLQNKGENESDSRIYEVGYLLVPSVKEEEVPARYGNFKGLVTSVGGEVISDEIPRMQPLAYSMTKVIGNIPTKFQTAYFGWTKFTMDPSQVAELKKKLTLDESVLRFLIIKTVRENTVVGRRFAHRDAAPRKPFTAKREESGEKAVPINKEEIDKEIDAMVLN